MEAREESISSWARLDCGRIYTVEDHLRVMKIGRIRKASLPLLETYSSYILVSILYEPENDEYIRS
ncbi:hypothetical protein V8F06_002584 [Rhypophila decipiens]